MYLDRYDAFRVARQMCEQVDLLADEFPVGHGSLRDQLRRSTQSVLLNLAEGLGKTAPREKRRSYVIARGEVHETRAALVIVQLRGLGTEVRLARIDELADRTGAMLWKMITHFE